MGLLAFSIMTVSVFIGMFPLSKSRVGRKFLMIFAIFCALSLCGIMLLTMSKKLRFRSNRVNLERFEAYLI